MEFAGALFELVKDSFHDKIRFYNILGIDKQIIFKNLLKKSQKELDLLHVLIQSYLNRLSSLG